MRERPAFSHAVFFFLGAGFMLVETKAITELGLTFGNTWHVIGISIAGILAMAFLATIAVSRWRLRGVVLPFVLLLASLGLGWYVSRAGGFAPTADGQAGRGRALEPAHLLLGHPVRALPGHAASPSAARWR